MTFPFVTELPTMLEPLDVDTFAATALRPSESTPVKPPAGRRIAD